MDSDLEQYRALCFSPSRIPAQDALEAFVPAGARPAPEIERVAARTGMSRWYPVDGGHRVLILYEGGPYDPEHLTLLKGGWDHEHCSRCKDRVEPMTLCWVTDDDPFVLLDDKCFRLVFGDTAANEELWP